jgi:dihydrofolate synthase/folylpolyglutamate synthase
LTALSIPGEKATLPAATTAAEAEKVGLPARIADSVQEAIVAIKQDAPDARILICGSLYLAGHVMRENGG